MQRFFFLAMIVFALLSGYSCEKDKDETPPVISLLGYNPYTVCVGTAYTDPGATAEDETDGDLTGQIITTVNVDTSQPGEGTVRYEVTDAAGNKATVVREVTVIYCRK